MSSLMPPTEDVIPESAIDILTRRVGAECVHDHLIEEVNATFGSAGVVALLDGPRPPFFIVKVPQALPQGVDACIIALIIVAYQELRLDLVSSVDSLNGFRRYTFL